METMANLTNQLKENDVSYSESQVICTIVLFQAAKRHGQEVGFDDGVGGVGRNNLYRTTQTTQTSFKSSFIFL